jgi:hypothetical protein
VLDDIGDANLALAAELPDNVEHLQGFINSSELG